MVATAAVIAHAGEEVLYVLVPLLVLYVGWRVWDRRWGASTEPGEGDTAPDQRSTPPKGSHDR